MRSGLSGSNRAGDFPLGDGIVDFGLEGRVNAMGGDDVEEGCADGGGGGVGAGEDLEDCFVVALRFGEAVADKGGEHVVLGGGGRGGGKEALADNGAGDAIWC